MPMRTPTIAKRTRFEMQMPRTSLVLRVKSAKRWTKPVREIETSQHLDELMNYALHG